MTNKQFLLAVIVIVIIYALVTSKKEEPNYAAYSEPQIQVMPYTQAPIPSLAPLEDYTISE